MPKIVTCPCGLRGYQITADRTEQSSSQGAARVTREDKGELDGGVDRASGDIHTPLPEDTHVQFRRCATCGAEDMRPETSFVGSGLGGSSEHGLTYKCESCGAEAKILDSGAFFMGTLYSLFWIAITGWALYEGPLWYIRHPNYFSGDYSLSFLPLDAGVILLSLAVAAFTGWFIWISLLGPLKTLIRHPVTGENRVQSAEEAAGRTRSKRAAFLSFFVYSLLLWAPLVGVFWALDAMGVDVQGNDVLTYGAVGAVLGLIVVLGRRYGANVGYAVAGMAFWLAVFIAVIFTYG